MKPCKSSGHVVKLPLICQIDRQTNFSCVGDKGSRFSEDNCISCIGIDMFHSDLCATEQVINSYLPCVWR